MLYTEKKLENSNLDTSMKTFFLFVFCSVALSYIHTCSLKIVTIIFDKVKSEHR